jgi:quinol monooxygenase YgiN
MKLGILALLEARPGQEAEVARLLESALALAEAEPTTVVWYAFQAGPRSFGIFDAFHDERGRKAHLEGRIAQALMGRADELLASPPDLRMVDLLAVKTGT